MFEKYVSLAQSFSTQYLAAQIEQVKHQKIKCKAYSEVLKSRSHVFSNSKNGQSKKK